MIILGDLQLGHKDLDTWKPGPNSAVTGHTKRN